jgi:UPF0716 family protein affecting phage T7 exclusion
MGISQWHKQGILSKMVMLTIRFFSGFSNNNWRQDLPRSDSWKGHFMSRTQGALIGGLLALDSTLSLLAAFYVGWCAVLVEVFAAGLLGFSVLGLASWRYGDAIAAKLDNDACLDEQLLNGPAMMLAGLMLVCPGLITDLMALALFIPRVRRLALVAMREMAEVPSGAPTILRFEQTPAQPRKMAA